MGTNEEWKGLKDKVLNEYAKGNIVIYTIEGLMTIPMEDFVKQPLEGMLYDLNRDLATITTFLDRPKWINNLALTKVLEYYYKKIQEYEQSK